MAEDAGESKAACAVVADASAAASAFQTVVSSDETAGNSAKVKHLSMSERAEKSGEEGELAGVAGLEYGELSFDNLLAVLNACAGDACGPLYEGADFVDAGSGVGKQVVGAALLPFKFRKCAGVELLDSLDGVAQGLVTKLKEAAEAEGGLGEGLAPCADVACAKGDLGEAVGGLIDPANQCVVLACATTYSDALLKSLTDSLAGAAVGSLLVTLTKPCPDVSALWEPASVFTLDTPFGENVTVIVSRKTALPAEA